MQPASRLNVVGAPFFLKLRPEDAVRHETWRRACEEALASLRRGQPVAVLGSPGTGKTFLLQRLTQLLASEGLRARRFEPSRLAASEGHDDISLVDEADHLPDAVLDSLCEQPGLFILAGLPEMARRLNDRPRPVTIVTLERLSPEDVARFVAARLSATGHRRDLFEAEAVLALAQHSAGLPRLVVTLAGAAMFLGEDEGCGQVTRQHVDEAAAMRSTRGLQRPIATGSEPPPKQVATPMVMPAAKPPEPRRHPAPLFQASRVTLALCGVALLAALGWTLVPRHAPSPMPAQPHREAALTRPAAPPSPSPPATPAADPAIVAPSNAGHTVAAQSPAAAPSLASPAPLSSSRQTERTLAFQGPIVNETMNQKGRLSLNIHRSGGTSVTASFQASAGLIGSGDLTGTMTPDGRITASGRLMMGRNPFDTTLTAIIAGDKLEGTAVFSRPDASSSARSRFSLVGS